MKPGDLVTWTCTPPGGWGFTQKLDAVVVKVGKRVKIRIETHHADSRRVAARGADEAWVSAEKLTPRAAVDARKVKP